MTARRDPDRLLRTYLEDGPTELPDRSYDAVRSVIDRTRQRVVLGPWREPQLSKSMPFAIAAAAVLVVAVVGFNLMPRPDPIANSGPTPTAAPTFAPQATVTARSSTTPTPSPSAAAVRLPFAPGELAAGTYYIDAYTVTQGVRMTFAVPAGWRDEDYVFIKKGRDPAGVVLLTPWTVTHVFRNACQWDGTLIEAGTTADDLVTALAEQEGRQASPATDVMIGGFPGKRIELTVPADLDVSTCSNGNLRFWPGPGPDMSSGLCCDPPGNTDAVYAVDVAGKRLVIVARHYPDSSAEDRAELQAIVDSIEIEPAGN